MLNVVWFKRDLRTADHRPLAAAAERGPLLPLYIAEPDLWQSAEHSQRQWSFVAESVIELRSDLAALGSPLVVRTGPATVVLDALHESHGIKTLWSHQETGNRWTFDRDRDVRRWCRRRGVQWAELRQHGVERGDSQRDGWAKRWRHFMAEPLTPAPVSLRPVHGVDPGRLPTAAELGLDDDGCTLRQAGGRRSGVESLDSFLADRGRHYRTGMSSPLRAELECSRLSPHLAWGTVSLRETVQALNLRRDRLRAFPRDETRAWTDSLKSFEGRLHWHCHFMQKLEDEPSLEFRNLHPAYDGLRGGADDPTRLKAWRDGETGFPFVDACMRSLGELGWINFRMRAMLMAFASYHLWLDWRKPGEHLASQFTDFEPGIHWSQVQMQSGTTGINTPRIYNPVKQGYDQDPDGRFVRRWVPELADVPDEFIHEPWKWSGFDGCVGDRYPHPVVDHLAAAKEARQKVWSVRRGADFRRQANDIQRKHGSRRRRPQPGRFIAQRQTPNPTNEGES